MFERPKIFSAINMLAIAIPLFFLAVFLTNPSFNDSLFFVALAGMLFMVIVFFVAMIAIGARIVNEITNYKRYFAVGIITFCSGILGIVCEIVQQFELPFFLYEVVLVLIGLCIMIDTLKNTKLAERITGNLRA